MDFAISRCHSKLRCTWVTSGNLQNQVEHASSTGASKPYKAGMSQEWHDKCSRFVSITKKHGKPWQTGRKFYSKILETWSKKARPCLKELDRLEKRRIESRRNMRQSIIMTMTTNTATLITTMMKKDECCTSPSRLRPRTRATIITMMKSISAASLNIIAHFTSRTRPPSSRW